MNYYNCRNHYHDYSEIIQNVISKRYTLYNLKYDKIIQLICFLKPDKYGLILLYTFNEINEILPFMQILIRSIFVLMNSKAR